MQWTPELINTTLKILRENNVLGFELGDFKVTFKGIPDPKNELPQMELDKSDPTISYERSLGFQQADDYGE